jgi:hypothetical protein
VTLVEKVAAELDADLLDLGPFLADGVAGFRRRNGRLTFALQLAGGDEWDLPELWPELGVDVAQVYRAMIALS